MEYKRKVTTQQEGITGHDAEFGNLKMCAKSKKMMPLVFAATTICLASGIFFSGVIDVSENFIALALGVFFLLFSLVQVSFVMDQIQFYEYGIVDSTFLSLRKKRLAYDDIDAIVEVKHRRMGKENKNVVSLWRVVGKPGKKTITIDATSYIGITNILTSVRQNTKIKNIE